MTDTKNDAATTGPLTTIAHMTAKAFQSCTFRSQRLALDFISTEGWQEHCRIEIEGALLIVCRDK